MSEAIATSPFANSAAEAKDAGASAGYVRALLDLLGDRDPFAVLEETPQRIEAIAAGLDDERLRRPERPGKWSIAEVVAHLADSELVMGYRFRRILADDRPPITGYDQDQWAQRLRYRDARLDDSLAQLRALRIANVRLIRNATPEELQRVGLHSERGEESAAHLRTLWAAHDLVHLRQIERIKAAVG